MNAKRDSDSSLFADTNIKHASIVGSLTDKMFYNCTSLESVSFNGTNALSSCFFNCSSLTSLSLPESLTAIEENAFNGCTSLSSINLSSTHAASIRDNFLYGNANITDLHLPATVNDVSACLGSNFLNGTSVSAVYFVGLTDEYMKAHGSLSSTFGSSMDASTVFYSSSNTRYKLNSNGHGLQLINVAVVTAVLTYAGDSSYSTLPNVNTISRFQKLVKDAYGSNYASAVKSYTKLGDRSGYNSYSLAATRSNLLKALDDAAARDPSLLIFLYSGHGISESICTLDSTTKYDDLFAKFAKFDRIFAIFCCCYPLSGKQPFKAPINSTDEDKTLGQMFQEYLEKHEHARNSRTVMNSGILFGDAAQAAVKEKKALFWAAGEPDEVTWGDDDHVFFMALRTKFSKSYSYSQQWNEMKKSDYFAAGFKKKNKDWVLVPNTVHPQVSTANGFNTSVKVFK